MSGDYDPEEDLAANAAYRDAVRRARSRHQRTGSTAGRGTGGRQQQREGDPSSLGPVVDTAVIGCADGCAIVLTGDTQVAGRHVEVRRHAGGAWSVRPLATMGTAILRVIGGRRRRLPVVSVMALQAGDVLEVGRTRSVPWYPR